MRIFKIFPHQFQSIVSYWILSTFWYEFLRPNGHDIFNLKSINVYNYVPVRKEHKIELSRALDDSFDLVSNKLLLSLFGFLLAYQKRWVEYFNILWDEDCLSVSKFKYEVILYKLLENFIIINVQIYCYHYHKLSTDGLAICINAHDLLDVCSRIDWNVVSIWGIALDENVVL